MYKWFRLIKNDDWHGHGVIAIFKGSSFDFSYVPSAVLFVNFMYWETLYFI